MSINELLGLGTPSEISKEVIDELEEFISGRDYDYEREVLQYEEGETRQALNFFFPGISHKVYIHVIGNVNEPFMYTVFVIDNREDTQHIETIGTTNTPVHAMTLHSLGVRDHYQRNPRDGERAMEQLRRDQFALGRREGL